MSSPVRGLRVLMTTDAVGGVFTYALTLAGELTRSGAEVHLATMGPPPTPAQAQAAGSIPGLSVHVSTYALEWTHEPWEDVARAGDWLLSLERRLFPDVVHLNGYCHGAVGFRAPVVVVGHSCVLSWWEAVLREPPPAHLAHYKAQVRKGIAGASAVIAPTSVMMHNLERHYGPIGNTAVVANGVRRPRTPVRPAPQKEVSVLAAGRLWDRAKNVAALARVAPRFPGPVRVAGADTLADGTRETLPNVETLGWLDPEALAEAMDRAAIFAHPARYEPFGLGPVEAALRGCALVLGDIESLREVWGDAALFVDPDDDDALAAVLTTLARDRELRRFQAARATDRAAAYSPALMAQGTAAVYLELVGADRRQEASCA